MVHEDGCDWLFGPDHADPDYCLGAVLAQIEDLDLEAKRWVLCEALTATLAWSE
jgi:hypothetical protein